MLTGDVTLPLELIEHLADLKAEGIYIGEATAWAVVSHRFRCLAEELEQHGRKLDHTDVHRLALQFERDHAAALHILTSRFPTARADTE